MSLPKSDAACRQICAIMEAEVNDMEENIIFRYSLINTWGLPLFWIEVMDTDKDNIRIYRFGSDSWKGDTDIIKPDHMTVTHSVISRIKEILEEHYELFSVSETEEPPELEGVVSHFRFVSGEKETEITAPNLWYFEDADARDSKGNEPLRARIVLGVFYRIRELLLKAGVDPFYLGLKADEE